MFQELVSPKVDGVLLKGPRGRDSMGDVVQWSREVFGVKSASHVLLVFHDYMF